MPFFEPSCETFWQLRTLWRVHGFFLCSLFSFKIWGDSESLGLWCLFRIFTGVGLQETHEFTRPRKDGAHGHLERPRQAAPCPVLSRGCVDGPAAGPRAHGPLGAAMRRGQCWKPRSHQPQNLRGTRKDGAERSPDVCPGAHTKDVRLTLRGVRHRGAPGQACTHWSKAEQGPRSCPSLGTRPLLVRGQASSPSSRETQRRLGFRGRTCGDSRHPPVGP